MRTKTFWEKAYTPIFLIRRFEYAILTIACVNNPNIHIHVFLISNILYLVYLGHAMPNDTKLARRMEYFNESGLQWITYHLALFPLVGLQEETRLGWSMVASVGMVFFGNLVVMIIMSI